jgi:hypothetical protein
MRQINPYKTRSLIYYYQTPVHDLQELKLRMIEKVNEVTVFFFWFPSFVNCISVFFKTISYL